MYKVVLTAFRIQSYLINILSKEHSHSVIYTNSLYHESSEIISCVLAA